MTIVRRVDGWRRARPGLTTAGRVRNLRAGFNGCGRATDGRGVDVGRFLCGDEAERRRMIDVGRALRPGTPFLLGLFVIAGLSGVPSYGWRPLLPPALAIA